MPLTLLDFALLGIMLISGLLALMRGFTREVLSLVAWGVAALVTYYILMDGRLTAWANASVPYLENEKVAMAAVGGAAFIVVLIVISIVSVRISDFVVDSRAGAFDRTLGLFYGFARGLVLVAIAYMFYVMWLVPESRHEPWIKNAATLPLIKFSRDGLFNLLPLQVQETLRQSATEDTASGADKTVQPEGGYKSSDDQGLENLIQGTGGEAQQPAPAQGTGQ
jgi:membrane protein required for colicin V production